MQRNIVSAAKKKCRKIMAYRNNIGIISVAAASA